MSFSSRGFSALFPSAFTATFGGKLCRGLRRGACLASCQAILIAANRVAMRSFGTYLSSAFGRGHRSCSGFMGRREGTRLGDGCGGVPFRRLVCGSSRSGFRVSCLGSCDVNTAFQMCSRGGGRKISRGFAVRVVWCHWTVGLLEDVLDDAVFVLLLMKYVRGSPICRCFPNSGVTFSCTISNRCTVSCLIKSGVRFGGGSMTRKRYV